MPYLGKTKPSETTSSVLRSTYTGNGSTTTYNLPAPVANETAIIATINGVTQQDGAYTTNGTQIIFDAAPALNDAIELRTISAVGMSYTPPDGSVVTGKIADLAVTTGKINDASVTGAKLATGAAVANIGARAITTGQMPAGTILQTVVSNPTLGVVGVGTASWTEVSSGFRVSITPTSASSTLLIQCLFMFGGVNTSVLSHFKIYDITNNADVNLATPVGSRIATHGAARQMDSDVNDTDMMQLSVSVSAGSTSARTYSLYTKNESGTTTKYFFGNVADSPALTVVRPVFVVYEIAA